MSGADASATAGGLNPHVVCGLPISTAHAARCTALSLRSAEPLSMTNGRTLFAFLDRQRLLMATVPAVRATMNNMTIPGIPEKDGKWRKQQYCFISNSQAFDPHRLQPTRFGTLPGPCGLRGSISKQLGWWQALSWKESVIVVPPGQRGGAWLA